MAKRGEHQIIRHQMADGWGLRFNAHSGSILLLELYLSPISKARDANTAVIANFDCFVKNSSVITQFHEYLVRQGEIIHEKCSLGDLWWIRTPKSRTNRPIDSPVSHLYRLNLDYWFNSQLLLSHLAIIKSSQWSNGSPSSLSTKCALHCCNTYGGIVLTSKLKRVVEGYLTKVWTVKFWTE